MFLNYLPTNKPIIAIDIEPKCETVNTGDFLNSNILYEPGTLVIGNPPFGRHMSLAKQFYIEATKIADYIAFILPVGQLDNRQTLYHFDLLKSVDMGLQTYTDRKLHCCFNVYRRPVSGACNSAPKVRLKDVTIIRKSEKARFDACKQYDLRMAVWGNGCAGKILHPNEQYAEEFKIVCHNNTNRNDIIQAIEKYDWTRNIKHVAMRKIQKHHVIRMLMDNVKGIQ